MASDLSSGGCTEVNEPFDDEKEEGEISLEDVSSSEEGQPYKYPQRNIGQCPYCFSMQNCSTWCRSFIANKLNVKRDAGLQGKENRSNQHYVKDASPRLSSPTSITGGTKPSNLYTLQEKNDDDTGANDLVPISSDSDMELVGLESKPQKKLTHRNLTPRKNIKLRKKRRKKCPPSMLSPSSVDLAQSIKESIHRMDPVNALPKKEISSSHSKSRHRSPEIKKSATSKSSPPQRKHSRLLPDARVRHSIKPKIAKSRARLPTPRKSSPLRPNKILPRKSPVSSQTNDEIPLKDSPSTRGNVNKLLKKVRRLDPFSTRTKDKSSSLKDKLSNIIKSEHKETTSAAPVTEVSNKEKSSTEVSNSEEATVSTITVPEQKEVIKEESKKTTTEENDTGDKDDEEDIIILRQKALETKQKKTVMLKPEEIKTEIIDKPSQSVPNPINDKLPNFRMDDNDEDLELRMIALRSAVLKKHRTRIQCGKKKQRTATASVPRMESPFTATFLEDFPLLAEICSPTSPNAKKDIYSTEDMELDSDMELDKEMDEMIEGISTSPYSPSDDINEMAIDRETENTDATLQNNVSNLQSTKQNAENLNLYSLSNPTTTLAESVNKHSTNIQQETTKSINKRRNDNLNENIVEFMNQESRPYSPTDITIYDPDLPGVHSAPTPPLLPPPLPPLSMFTPQPIVLGCPSNLLNVPFVDPVPVAPVSPPQTSINNFTAFHQSMNPILLPTAGPFFSYPTPAPPVMNSITTPNLINQSTDSILNELDNFGETDLDGSPLVPMEKDNNNQASWPFMAEPLYLQNVPSIIHSDLSKVPTLIDPNLVPAPVLKTNKQLQKQPLRRMVQEIKLMSEGAFKNAEMMPVVVKDNNKANNILFKPMKLQPAIKKCMTTQSASVFNTPTEDDIEENMETSFDVQKTEHEQVPMQNVLIRKKKRRKRGLGLKKRLAKELMNNNQKLKPVDSCTLKDKNSTENIRLEKNEKNVKVYDDTNTKLDDNRRTSVDDDEETLRELLLASLAKRSKEQPTTKIPALEASVTKTATKQMELRNQKASPIVSPVVDKDKDSQLNIKNNLSSNAVSTQIPKSTLPTKIPVPAIQTTTTKLIAEEVSAIPQVKRPATASLIAEQPLRKIAKKSIIPASTKVVNNAKRYQNLMIQRKLTQQKISLIASSKNRFKINNATSNLRSSSPSINKPIAESQRIIINLNEDTDTESEVEESKISPIKNRPVLAIPTTDFEKSVDQFLKGVRMQQEMSSPNNSTTAQIETTKSSTSNIATSTTASVTATKTVSTISPTVQLAKTVPSVIPSIATTKSIIVTTSNTTDVKSTITTSISTVATALKEKNISSLPKNIKTISLTATPQAVKHLPASQQEEYRRLKQQIFEREKLKLQKSKESTTVPSMQTSFEKSVNSSPNSLSLSSSSSNSLKTSTIVSSTPKNTSQPVKVRELLALNKTLPKTQLVATISPMSKQVEPSKTLGHNISKIIHSNSNQESPTNKFTALSNSRNKNILTSNSKPILTSPKVAKHTDSAIQNINKKQVTLLDKMNNVLNSQRLQISSVAQKVSNLRILTKEQINLKTSQLKQATKESNNSIAMDDLNKINKNTLKNVQSEAIVVLQKVPILNKSLESSDASNNIKNNSEQLSLTDKADNANKSNQNWEDFKEFVNNEVQSLTNLCLEEQKELLCKTEEELITKRHSVLDDITEMSGSLRQWEIERDLQNVMNIEIKKLREQLKLAEEKLQQQKDKLNTIQPKVSNYHEKINSGRKECFRLSKICNGLGQHVIGPNYKVPSAGAELLNNRIKEVATHTQKLRSKKNKNNELSKTNFPPKTDKTKTKLNFKSDSYNTKQKELEKKTKTVNNTMVDSESISVEKNSDLSKNTVMKNNLLTVTNSEKEISNTEITETEGEDLNKNVNSESNLSIVLMHDVNTILTQECNFNVNNEKSITSKNISNTFLNTDRVLNNESEKTSDITHVNTTLIIENTGDIRSDMSMLENNVLNINQMEEVNLVCNDQQLVGSNNNSSMIENESIESPILDTTEIKKEFVNTKIENEFIESDDKNLCINTICNIKIESSEPVVAGHTNIISSSERSMSEDESFSQNSNVDSAFIIQSNNCQTEGNNNQPGESTANSSMLVEENVDASETVMNTDNSIMNINSINETSEKESNKSIDSNTTLNTINSEPKEPLVETDNITIENVRNITDNSLNNADKIKLLNNIINENNSNSKLSSTSEALVDSQRSTLLEEIALLEQVNEITVPEKIVQYTRSSTNAKDSTKLSEQVDRSEPVQQNRKELKKNSVQPYESILKHLHIPRSSKTDGILCPYELMGTCNDGDCQYIHQSTSHGR